MVYFMVLSPVPSHPILSTNTYKSWLFKLLDREIKRQSKTLQQKKKKLKDTTNDPFLKSKVSLFDFKCLSA